MKVFIIVISFVLCACNGQKKAAMEDKLNSNSEAENPLELIMSEDQGGFEADEMLVIKDAKRLKSFFSKVNRTRKPGLPVPDIDFSTNMVIIQCVGEEKHTNLTKLSIVKETNTELILGKMKAVNSEHAKLPNANFFSVYQMPLSQKQVVLEKQVE